MEAKTYSIGVSRIELSEQENQLSTLEVLKTGKFQSKTHGNFSITKEMLLAAKKNFDDKAHKLVDENDNPIALLNFDHDKKIAAGWIKALELNDDGTKLIAKLDLTPIGREKVINKEYVFASAEFAWGLQDPESGQIYENVLTGAALTNKPFMKGLKPIELTEKEFNMEEILNLINDLSQEEIVALMSKLQGMVEPKEGVAASEDKKELSEKEGEEAEETDKETEEPKDNTNTDKETEVELSERISFLEAEHAKKVRELEFAQLVLEKKAVPAQKEAYLANDLKGVIENSIGLNFDQSSDSHNPKEEKLTEETALDKIVECADSLVKENPAMEFAEAMKVAYSKNAEAKKLINLTE